MSFRTKINLQDNRQHRLPTRESQDLSGTTVFGVQFSGMTTGADPTNSGTTGSIINIPSTFSGNTGTTVFNFGDSGMDIAQGAFSALTLSNSATTQNSGNVFVGNISQIIDGNSSFLDYTGTSFDFEVLSITETTLGVFTGTGVSDEVFWLSAGTLDFTGRTIWNDTVGISRTEKLIVSNGAIAGYSLFALNSDGDLGYVLVSGGTSGVTPLWSAGTGTDGVVLNNSGGDASGILATAEGKFTTASGIWSHAEGFSTIASGQTSHAEGNATIASGITSHAEGVSTIASGFASHSQGSGTEASGFASHAEGNNTLAIGNSSHAEGNETEASGAASHAGGYKSEASGYGSFVHGSDSVASGINTIVFGVNITGTTDNTVYVPNLNIGNIGIGAPVINLGLDVNGNVVTGTTSGSTTGTTFWEVGDACTGSFKSTYGNALYVNGIFSFIGGGDKNSILGGIDRSAIIAGTDNTLSGAGTTTESVIIGGDSNFMSSTAGFQFRNIIAGGTANKMAGRINDSAIIVGDGNYIINTSSNSVIVGGQSNQIDSALRSVIIGGQNITGDTTDMVYVPDLIIDGLTSTDPIATDARVFRILRSFWDCVKRVTLFIQEQQEKILRFVTLISMIFL